MTQEHVQQDSRTGSMQAVQELLDASKTHNGRHQLLVSGQLEGAALRAVGVFCQWELKVLGDDFEDQQQLAQHTLLLRVLRNCCALGPTAATLLLQHNVHQTVAAAAANGADSCCTQQGVQQPDDQQASILAVSQLAADLITAAAQFLHNLAATGPEGAAGVWTVLFPATLESLLLVDNGRVHEAVALTCLACARFSSQALQDLTSPAAHTTWCRLLAPLSMHHQQQEAATEPQHQPTAQQQAVSTAGTTPSNAGQETDAAAQDSSAVAAPLAVPPGNDNLCLLIKYVAMLHSKLQALMQLLAPQQQGTHPSTASTDAAMPFAATEWHAVLLHVVAVEAAAVPAASPLPGVLLEAAGSSSCGQQAGSTVSGSGACSGRADWLQYAVQLLQKVWSVISAAAAPAPGVCSRPTADAHVLEAILHVLRAVLARDEDTAEPQPKQEAEAAAAAGLAAVAQYLHSLGLVQQLLQMLTALGPPPKPKQQQQRELEQQQGQSVPPQQQEPAPQHQQPYAGYRADVVAVLSNILLGGREVQAAVMAAGGIEQLLNNCNLDDTAPMAREWALWGIRNACKDNEDVQQYVSQFQAVEAVQTPELDKMGMQLELDQMTHKLKLTKKPDGQVDCVVENDE